jgi:hypothetical protein
MLADEKGDLTYEDENLFRSGSVRFAYGWVIGFAAVWFFA